METDLAFDLENSVARYVLTQPHCTHLLDIVSTEDLHGAAIFFLREDKEASFSEDVFTLLAAVDVPNVTLSCDNTQVK